MTDTEKRTPIESRLHLCESCKKQYPECNATSDGIVFGCGEGNDNIIGCAAYVNRWMPQPHVMTVEEMLSPDGAVLVEYNPDRLTQKPEWMFIDYIVPNGQRPSAFLIRCDGKVVAYTLGGYGKTWRCWTGEPSAEQKENEPWS